MNRTRVIWSAVAAAVILGVAGASYWTYSYIREKRVDDAFASGSLERVAGLPPTICESSRPDIKGKTQYELRIYDGRIRLDEYRTANKELSRIRIYRDHEGRIFYDAKTGSTLGATVGQSAGAREILGGPWDCHAWYWPDEDAFQDERGSGAEWVVL